MYAIIQEGGGQRKVRVNDVITVDLLNEGASAPGTKITFDRVLALGQGDGAAVAKIGQPFVAGASVTAEVVEGAVKGDKIYVHKFRRRKGYRRKTGHRQSYTQVRVTAING
jgi:large subunit ribosomal protein L21